MAKPDPAEFVGLMTERENPARRGQSQCVISALTAHLATLLVEQAEESPGHLRKLSVLPFSGNFCGLKQHNAGSNIQLNAAKHLDTWVAFLQMSQPAHQGTEENCRTV